MNPMAITGVGAVTPVGFGLDSLSAAFEEPAAAKERAFGGEATVLSPEKFP